MPSGYFAPTAKRTPQLLPFCHPIALTGAAVTLEPDPAVGTIRVEATVRATDGTGALQAAGRQGTVPSGDAVPAGAAPTANRKTLTIWPDER